VETREVKTKKQGGWREDDEEDGWSMRAIGDQEEDGWSTRAIGDQEEEGWSTRTFGDQEEDGWDDGNSILEWKNEGSTRERAFQSDHHGLR
jgi:hypothetical protein